MFLCSYNPVVYCILVKQRAAIVVEVFAVSVSWSISGPSCDVCFMPNTVHLYTKEHQ